MNFLNSPALWGGLAAAGVAVPIIIHLLHQRHRRRTDWAAMELLRRALVIRSGQVRLEDLLLLFLRCLVLALVAFALLRPILDEKTAGYLDGEQTVAMVIAIDASYSMEHGRHERRMDAAKSRVREILSNAKDSDFVKIVLLGDKPRDLLKGHLGTQDFSEKVDSIEPYLEPLNLERGLQEIAASIDQLEATVIECYIVTDAQEIDWKNLSAQARDSLNDISEKANLFITPVKVDGESGNLAVVKFGYASGSLGHGGTARFTAEIKNFGGQSNEGSKATFMVNGQPENSQTLGSIPAGATKAISFFTSFEGIESANLSVILSPDSLSFDNERHTVVEAQQRIRILCVDGEPASDAKPSEIFWLVKALELKQVGENESIEATRIHWRDLQLEVDTFPDFDIIALANVAQIESNVANGLNEFVNNGGGLVIFAGDLVDVESYNENLRGAEVKLLPGELVEAYSFGNQLSTDAGEEDSWTLAPIESDHVLAALAKNIPEEARSSARFQRIMKVKPDSNAITILSLAEANQPLLLEKKAGLGSILMFNTSADREWSNLAVHPLFPMLMQQATTYLTSRFGQNDALVGDSAYLTMEGQEEGASVALRTPDSNQSIGVALTMLEGKVACPIETDASGFYTIEAKDSPPVSMAVNVNPREADTREVKADDWETILAGSKSKVIPRLSNNLASIVTESRKGMEISRTLLLLALAIFILQGFLAKLFTKRMTSSGESKVEEKLRKHATAAARRS